MSHTPLAFDRAIGDRDALAFDRSSARSFDADGRMHVERCNIAKACVSPYLGREIINGAQNGKQLALDPNKVYKLYRDPEELRAAADTFKKLQLLLVHAPVTAKSPKTEVTVGCVGSAVAFDGTYLTADLAVWTDEAIALIESGKQAQLSPSYRYRADMTPGVSPDGVAYDGVMRDIMGNHVALVEQGRQGPDVYVSDSQPLELSKMKRPALVAAIAAALAASQITVSDEAKVALDAALDTELAKEPKPEPAVATDEAIAAAVDAAIASRGFVSKADAERMANDAATKASADAVARVNALHKARKDVEPLVGVVALDSAEEVYRFALDKAGVEHKGVHESALGALVEQVKAAKSAKSATPPAPRFANDAANIAAQAIPALGRFQIA
jgi:hypothetical protein